MKNYLRAEWYRVRTRPLFLILHFLFPVIAAGSLIYAMDKEHFGAEAYFDAASMTDSFLLLGIMLFYLFRVVGAGEKAKIPAAALGRGLERKELAAAKLAELLLLGLFSTVFGLITEFIGAVIVGAPQYMFRIMAADMLDTFLPSEIGLIAALIILTLGGRTIHAMAGFFVFMLDIPGALLYYITAIPAFMDLPLGKLTVTGAANRIARQISFAGHPLLLDILILAVYMAVFVMLFFRICRKKEPEI